MGKQEFNHFPLQQQKVILEHLKITKHSTPSKNYSHVPCKFFKQGNCQAGDHCPFSHELKVINSANSIPCKYYQKGNCKFGSNCANLHIDPPSQENQKSFSTSSQKISPKMSDSLLYGSTGLDEFDEFEEYYIPSECSDLLTPEELKRRKSRSYSSSSVSSNSSYISNNNFSPPSSVSSSTLTSSPSYSYSSKFLTTFPTKYYPSTNQFNCEATPMTPNWNQQIPPQFQTYKLGQQKPSFQQSMLEERLVRRLDGNDLTRYRILEEDEDRIESRPMSNAATPINIPIPVQISNHYDHRNIQDTQFFFDDLPVSPLNHSNR
ncbi:hypothetical protein Kpol_154p2 [Vanderwaltozyma polyspora DSM 70294]|uniref:C3H1-type domain-containing protein n=1 Tax=Vanderwaltozyma polyspora (strain ATCC 22028 / DSM 70294 / BCRC 21397 / CBS 2163 / NBRC 10782 / NRRL Y-8283 / UCD 57-17) TaxID=436907 RepID=A7TTU4_VANPO|nr:uncharacterized protein Kpol_154p2 [Vanderwaltozyma polyspora DSM 70294]EDO14314.1 hypothetical protein Kpol_154p2 [Vanderwaltozyma polyspora DSM 70294]